MKSNIQTITDNCFKTVRKGTKHVGTFISNEFTRPVTYKDIIDYLMMSDETYSLYDVKMKMLSISATDYVKNNYSTVFLRVSKNYVYVDYKNAEYRNFTLNKEKFFDTYKFFSDEVFNTDFNA